VENARGWTIPEESVNGRAYGTEDGVSKFTAGRNFGTWIHEYIHLEQGFSLGGDLTWFTEASAEYFEKLAGLYLGIYEFSRFYKHVSYFSWSKPIANISYSPHPRAYDASALLGALDAEIRTSSGDTTLAAVFRSMNEYDGTISYDVFADLIAEAAGERLDEWLEANILESANTSMPNDVILFLDRDQYDIPLRYEQREWELERHTVGVAEDSDPQSESQVAEDSEFSGTAEKDLVTPVVQYVNALDRDDFDAATAVIHSDAETDFRPAFEFRDLDFGIQTLDVNKQSDRPIVRATVVYQYRESDANGTLRWDIELMREDATWKMYRINYNT